VREKPEQHMQAEPRLPTPYRAILFDVGGPLDMETEYERLIDDDICAALAREGFPVSEGDYRAAERWAVQSFCPSLYQAVIWRLTGADLAASARVYDWVQRRSAQRRLFQLRPGTPQLLAALHVRGLLLGLAANQPSSAIASLDDAGIGRYFHHREVSGIHGFRKPDVRVFLRACESLAVAPAECIMVGDRIDNDIAPARLLGMGTVLFRTGRHAGQQPRAWTELPHAEVQDVAGLEAAILQMLSDGGRSG
jgi:putative hydrolase of the HAD superfamily